MGDAGHTGNGVQSFTWGVWGRQATELSKALSAFGQQKSDTTFLIWGKSSN